MSCIINKLLHKGLIPDAPLFLGTNVQYETIMGSYAFGVADVTIKNKSSDIDVYGWAIPPKNFIYKHLTGYIPGFGQEPPGFDQYQKHHIIEKSESQNENVEWDLNIYSIIKFFNLCTENNPNILDSLFTPEECVVYCTKLGEMVRKERSLFLSKLYWKKICGFAKTHMKKMTSKTSDGNRAEIIHKFGFDVKIAYHIVRLFDQAEQIMLDGTLDLQKASDLLKTLRRGEWTAEDVQKWVAAKEKNLNKIYDSSKMPEKPPYEPIRLLLLNCLEQFYGSMEGFI